MNDEQYDQVMEAMTSHKRNKVLRLRQEEDPLESKPKRHRLRRGVGIVIFAIGTVLEMIGRTLVRLGKWMRDS